MREGEKIREILAALPSNQRLFRINAGLGWVGKIVRHEGNILILKNPRPLRAAPAGWPDLAGWSSIKITEEMVGQNMAVFTGKEVKLTGKLSKEQKAFGKVLTGQGGFFEVVKE